MLPVYTGEGEQEKKGQLKERRKETGRVRRKKKKSKGTEENRKGEGRIKRNGGAETCVK